MPDLQPTPALAVLNDDGSVSCAFPNIHPDGPKCVPCLIMPAPRPIEEAPRGGPDLLLWAYDRWMIGYWDAHMGWWNQNSGRIQPTHWLPMPPNPEETTCPSSK